MPIPVTTQIWSSTVAQNGYLIVKKVQSNTAIAGVMSCSQFDIDTYNGDTYRNELSGNFIGPVNWYSFNMSGMPVSIAPITPLTSPFDQTTESEVILDDIAATCAGTPIPPYTAPERISFFLFWSGATGTGNVLAMCKVEDFVEFSIVPSQSIF